MAQAAQMRRHPRLYIAKPIASSRGRGIRLITSLSQLPRRNKRYHHCIMQHYVRHPLLIDGYKWDMRVCLAITSFNPLRAYLYGEGLARFASEKYSVGRSALRSTRVHLTNYSVNKVASFGVN